MRATSYIMSVLIFASSFIFTAYSLDYSDMESLGISCPDKDSCVGIGRDSSFYARNCECDYSCAQYRDCCIDAPVLSSSRTSNRVSSKICIPFNRQPNLGVYAVGNCPSSYSGPEEMRLKCEGPNDLSDPLVAAVPITDTQEHVTYKNQYCAVCNDVETAHQITWQIVMDCEGLDGLSLNQSYLWSKLKYGTNKWEVDLGDGQNHPCEMGFEIPTNITNSVRMCRADIISTCPRNWRRQTIKRLCESYMAIVGPRSRGDDYYRNPHCAMCNGITVDSLTCIRPVSGRRKTFSFALLLDVNQNDGDKVGYTNQGTNCRSNQKYDPYFKKCRRLVCAGSDYVIRDGKCVRP